MNTAATAKPASEIVTHMRQRFLPMLVSAGILLSALVTQSQAQPVIHTIAGSGTPGFSGDGGQAVNAVLSAPTGITVDAAGNLIVCDFGNNRVRKITPAGVITTIAGGGPSLGDGGQATSAQITAPVSTIFDAAGNLYVAGFGEARIRKITPAGIISTIAGTGVVGFSGDGGQAASAKLYSPIGLAFDSTGNLYFSDRENARVRKITMSTGVITTVAGNGFTVASGDGAQATSAGLHPYGAIAIDASNNLYIADNPNHRIRRVTPAGIITTVVGTGVAGASGDGGQALSATINAPYGIKFDANGNLYIGSIATLNIRMVTPAGVISTIAGNGTTTRAANGASALSGAVAPEMDIAFDALGNLYFTSFTDNHVRKITRAVPAAPTIGTATGGANQASVAFTPPPFNGGAPVTGYTATCGSATGTGTVSPIIVSGLTSGVAVTCSVRATNYLGNSAASAASNSVTPIAPQTIVFGAAPLIFANVGNVITISTGSLSATGGLSGNAVVFTSSTPSICTVSGTNGATVTGVNSGTCSINANQAGNATYAPAAQASLSFTVWLQRHHLASSQYHTLAIRADGTLWSWGSNTSGQLGIGSNTNSTVAVQIGSGTNWVSVAAGVENVTHSAALRADGTLWMWGANNSGQLGNGTTNAATSPVQVGSATNWTAVTLGANHTLALKSDGTLWGWGNSGSRQLGINNNATNASPLQIGTATNWGVIAAGEYHSLALRTDGTLWGWGDNNSRHLSNIGVVTINTPTQLDASTNWRTISGGFRHSLGIRTDGTLWGWGVIGNGSTATTIVITQSGTATNWSAIAATNNHSLGLKSDGSLWSWGEHYLGVLGSGLPDGVYPTPAQVGTATTWRAVDAGRWISAALRVDGGEVSAWGWGGGTVGDGTTAIRTVPTQSLTAPVIGTATTLNGSVTVAFTPFAATYNTVTGYIATSTPDNITASCVAPCNSINISGLTLGTSYSFTVATTNAAGTGRASVASNSVTPATVPAAPVIGIAAAGIGEVSVAFTPPSNNGGVTITSYTATCGANSQSGSVSPIIVTELVSASVTCSVVAINSVGTSAPSAASNNVTPLAVPDAPVIGVATAGTASVSVAFTPPINNGASAITSYTANCGANSTSGAASPLVVTGLANAAVTCTVTATNAVGVSTPSAASNSVTPVTVANAPTAVSATAGNGTITVSFTPPLANGGSAIASYTATCGSASNSAASSPITVSGLTNGLATTCVVRATNAVGNSAPSAASNSVTPMGTQTITFGMAPSIVVGVNGVVSANGGGSGNAVIFTSNTPTICSVSGLNGSTVTSVSAGTCIIAANQAASASFVAAPEVTQTFTVGLGSQVIVFGTAPVMIVGGSGTVSANGGASTNPVTFTSLTASICSVSGNTVLGVAVGLCTIEAAQAGNSNYNAGSAQQSFSISPVSQAIMFGTAPSIGVGGSGTVSANGGGSGNAVAFTSNTPAVCSVSGLNGSTVTSVSAGTCIIAANQAASATFSAAPEVTQTFTVGLGSQVVIFVGAAPVMIVGGNGTLSASGGASGNPVTFASLTASTCSVSGNTVLGVAVGVCTVQASQAGNSNYNAGSAQQSFSIGQASQIITFNTPAVFVGIALNLQASGGSSGNALTYTSATPSVCALSGSNGEIVTGISVGACTLTANQAGNANYTVAAAVSITFYTGASVTLAAGGAHGIALRLDGSNRTLWAWGLNSVGQVGDGTSTSRSSPVQIGGASSWASLSAGAFHNLALRTDGTLWTWGGNFNGQLGDGTTDNRSSPMQVGNVTTWVAVSAGREHSAGLRSDGTLWTWGQNHLGQLGEGTDRSSPMQVGSATNWIAVSAGEYHTLALRTDGTLWAWGLNTSYQLGDNTTSQRLTPTQIGSDTNWMAVSAGGQHSIALKNDGSLWTWGTTVLSPIKTSPTQNGTATNWTAIHAATFSGFALRTDGTAWAWGDNNLKTLGNATWAPQADPTPVVGGATWASIASLGNFSAARRIDGTIWTWGSAFHGQLGDGTNVDRLAPGMALAAPVIGVATVGAGSVSVTFTALGATFNPVTGYTAISSPGNIAGSCVAPCSSINVTGLTSGSAYTFAVAAINVAGAGMFSQASNSVTLTGIAQTITFGAAPTVIVGGTGTVSATGGASGNAVVFSSTTPSVCIVSGLNGETVTRLSVGTCTIAADQPGNATYLAAAQVTQSFNVAAATYTVTPSAGANGTISPSVATTVTSGAASAFTITPNSGYSASVGGTCGGSLVGTTYTTNTVVADCTVVAGFTLNVALNAVQSRKTHGAAGTFDLAISTTHLISGNVDVEPRAIGAGHTIVFQFNQAVTSIGSVTAVNASSDPIGVASAVINMSNTTEVVVTLTGIADASRVTVTLNGVNGSLSSAVSLGFLVGDVNNNRSVGNTDIAAMKTRIGLNVDSTNFKYDINASGTLTNTDVAAAKTRVGLGI